MEKNNISENIRFLRDSKGYSQGYVSDKLKVTQQAYSRMEKNPENMSLKRLRDLSKILGVELITILDEDNAYIQHNFNQKGGQAATKMVFNQASQETSNLYERLINQLKDEVEFLRMKK
jgi:transcriptional regulator with XRE-family HTH domain